VDSIESLRRLVFARPTKYSGRGGSCTTKHSNWKQLVKHQKQL